MDVSGSRIRPSAKGVRGYFACQGALPPATMTFVLQPTLSASIASNFKTCDSGCDIRRSTRERLARPFPCCSVDKSVGSHLRVGCGLVSAACLGLHAAPHQGARRAMNSSSIPWRCSKLSGATRNRVNSKLGGKLDRASLSVIANGGPAGLLWA